jgi:hypothetical protein
VAPADPAAARGEGRVPSKSRYRAKAGMTATVTVAVELLNPVVPGKLATIVLFPVARALLFNVNVPVALAPDPVSAADPSKAVPRANVTLPVGLMLPLAAFTVTVSSVVPGFAPGLAVTVRIVAVVGAVTLTVTEDDELLKLPVEE